MLEFGLIALGVFYVLGFVTVFVLGQTIIAASYVVGYLRSSRGKATW